jgi:hypothetical protein
MIRLRSDCLVFETSSGHAIPASAAQVTIELLGDAAELLDPEMIHHAAAAVLHYFKHDQGRTDVTVAEFASALERVLRGFGLSIVSAHAQEPPGLLARADLRALACESGKGCELFFFSRLRGELRARLAAAPRLLHFRGLRGCVKQILGARRWGPRCERLSDQIVHFLRDCAAAEGRGCALLVN